jgi:hypothetical protein
MATPSVPFPTFALPWLRASSDMAPPSVAARHALARTSPSAARLYILVLLPTTAQLPAIVPLVIVSPVAPRARP